MADVNLANVNEESTAYLTVKFYDKTNSLAAPASATWQVHDVESGSILLAEVAIAPIASSVELELTAAINTIVNPMNKEELRRVTVKSTSGVGIQANAEYDYNVIDLSYVT